MLYHYLYLNLGILTISKYHDMVSSPHCRSRPPPAPLPGTSCPSPSSGPLPSLPPPPGNYQLFKTGVFCCDQKPCTKDTRGRDHSVFLKTMNCDETACFKACDADLIFL
eukprot:SAG31_NODE_30_length_32545_cov_9.378999_25_plen_109_part_00